MRDKIRWLWRYYRHYKYVLAVMLLLTPVQAVFQVSVPRMIDYTIDYLDTEQVPDSWLAEQLAAIGGGIGVSPVTSFGLGFMVLGLIAAFLYSIVQGHRAWMNIRLEWLFRQDGFDRITTKGPDFFNKFRTGDVVTRLTDDVAEKLSWFACSGIFRMYEAVLMITFTVTMMIIINPKLTLFAAGPLPVLIFVFMKTSGRLDRRYDTLQKRISTFQDVMEACLSGIRVVKAYVREKAQKGKFEEAAVERRKAEIDTIKTSTIVDSMYMYIWQLSVIIILIAGGYMVINGDISRGKLGSFIFYTVWLVFPMFDIGQFLVKSRQSAVSINRLQELEDLPPMVTDTGTVGNGHMKGEVAFDKTDFIFPDSSRKILDEISIEIKTGQTVALVGRVGSGKTWMINTLPRLVDPTAGSITLDGRELREYKLEDLRSMIGYVPQEPVLFSDTIRNNILFGRDGISEEIVDWAVEVAQLKNEMDQFPKGLDTYIGTRGMSVSGGQKQRIALARALVGRPKLLILDDCTSALDSRTEAALWERLHEVMPEMTALLITHRPDTLERADMIYVLEAGKVIEKGRHAELMADKTTYARIYRRYQLEEQVA